MIVCRIRLDVEDVVVSRAIGVGAAGRANHSHVETPVVSSSFSYFHRCFSRTMICSCKPVDDNVGFGLLGRLVFGFFGAPSLR